MNFKKYLTVKDSLSGQAPLEAGRHRRPTVAFSNLLLTGQAALEYFIIFSMITFLTILSFSSFDDSVSESTRNFSKNAIKRILQ